MTTSELNSISNSEVYSTSKLSPDRRSVLKLGTAAAATLVWNGVIPTSVAYAWTASDIVNMNGVALSDAIRVCHHLR